MAPPPPPRFFINYFCIMQMDCLLHNDELLSEDQTDSLPSLTFFLSKSVDNNCKTIFWGK
jgi:hypothetical protein